MTRHTTPSLRLRAPVMIAALAGLWSAGALAQATDVKIGSPPR
ncbi:hypothetical protein C7399_102315 [Paraburkholderia tropica]|uniref:ABC transporter substrate-binding protein n=1 Tax=Paraburkholderia tropica TaxID=92647 RepID=A0ABX5MVY4_9BURK|nr:hypothetical protein C7400_102315 [Paraburkholderia tropica]PZW88831.1 hypothetical protein C7399_102315 [Paraburkholderia tropica]